MYDDWMRGNNRWNGTNEMKRVSVCDENGKKLQWRQE